jgi:uncharacterized protein
MKTLLILLAIAAGVRLWKRSRRISASGPNTPTRVVADPQPMLRCARCGVHLPASNTVAGRKGRAYCCLAHRRQVEGG